MRAIHRDLDAGGVVPAGSRTRRGAAGPGDCARGVRRLSIAGLALLLFSCGDPATPGSSPGNTREPAPGAAVAADGEVRSDPAAVGADDNQAATSPPPAYDGPRPNVLMITLDTTRTDHLGCYGYAEAETPAIDSLAARGVVFEEAYTPAPMTLPAHSTMLTGVLPPEHGARVNGEHRLGDDVPSLAEELQSIGYRTGAFVAAFVLNHRFGLSRGFDHYDDDLTGAYDQEVPSGLARYRPGNLVADAALEWLDGGDPVEPFFAWVHFYDAHYPWFAHDLPEGEEPTPGSGSYDGEIAFMDSQVGRLLEWLSQKGLTDDTIVMALADHGEGLGDHGEIEHAYLLNEEVLHVPWIAAGPGIEAGHRVTALVSLEDFRPTVNRLIGLPAPDVRGRSLLAALQGQEIESGVGYAETDLPYTAYRWAPQRSLTTERWKYIRTPRPELYDRTNDRAELANLIGVKKNIHQALEERLSQLEAEMGERESEAASLSSDEIEQLAALGYTVGGNRDGAAESGGLADVKDRLEAKSLAAQLREGQAKETIGPEAELQMASRLVQMSPETPSFHAQFGQALIKSGNVEQGLEELELVVKLVPEDAGAHYDFGDALQQAGFTPQARVHLEKALELEPKMAAAHVGMGNVLRSEGSPDLAAGSYTEAISLRDGHYPEAHFNLALTYLDRNKPEKSEEHFKLAIEQKPGWGLAHSSLANLYANWGKGVEAVEQYQQATALLPDDPDLRIDFGVVLAAVDRVDDAKAQYEAAAQVAPEYFRPHIQLGNLAFDRAEDAAAIESYEEALRLAPGLPEPYARLARLLATCPDDAHRNAERALALAQRAADLAGPNPRVLDTLAAAQAANGDCAEALKTAHQAQQLAAQAGNVKLAAAIEQRVALYALDKPYLVDRSAPADAGEESGEGQ